MQTYLDCYPCFFRQSIDAARISGLNPQQTKKMLEELGSALPQIKIDDPPPVMAITIHNLVKKHCGNDDPYLEIKKHCMQMGQKMADILDKRIKSANDPLLEAVKAAILGNIIDYGISGQESLEKKIDQLIKKEESAIKHESSNLFNYEAFQKSLAKTDSLLYLGDNTGEIYTDALLLDQIKSLYPNLKIYFAVRGKPILNDALFTDAQEAGIDRYAEIIDSASPAPGTALDYCSPDFKELFFQSPLIISKGQGNFETLSEVKAPIYFLLMAKCPVVAQHIHCQEGDVLLLKSPHA